MVHTSKRPQSKCPTRCEIIFQVSLKTKNLEFFWDTLYMIPRILLSMSQVLVLKMNGQVVLGTQSKSNIKQRELTSFVM